MTDDAHIKQIADYVWRKLQPGESGVSRDMIAKEIREAMDVMGQVSVSLGEITALLTDDSLAGHSYTEIARAVLDKAGVKYVE